MTPDDRDGDSTDGNDEPDETSGDGEVPPERESTNQSADESSVTPDFEEEFPSVTAGTDETASPSAGVGQGVTDSPESGVSPADPDGAADPDGTASTAGGDGLGWQGWVLVGGLIVAMVLVPWAIVFLPEIQGALGSLGLGLRDAYLVLPMIPAVGLGALAVWAAVAYRRRQS